MVDRTFVDATVGISLYPLDADAPSSCATPIRPPSTPAAGRGTDNQFAEDTLAPAQGR